VPQSAGASGDYFKNTNRFSKTIRFQRVLLLMMFDWLYERKTSIPSGYGFFSKIKQGAVSEF
jgi:hypothetical protein